MDFADAVAIAARIFGGSRDRSGGLLLAHGIEVAQALGPSTTSTAMNTAVLHDVVEDSEWTISDLEMSGVDPAVCEAVEILTRRTGETYVDYVKRICDAPGLAGEIARLVKVADLTVNSARVDSDALRERYERSLPLVQSALAPANR